MKLKVTLQRPGGGVVDIAATLDTTVTVGELASALLSRDPVAPPAAWRQLKGQPTLAVQVAGSATTLDPDTTVADSGLRSGATVSLTRLGAGIGEAAAPAAILRVTAGPDSGREFKLRRGASVVGRGTDCDIQLSDPMVSRQHVRLHVLETVDVVDLASANGVLVDGVPIEKAVLGPDQRLQIGDTVATVQLTGGSATTTEHLSVAFNRSPRVEPRYAGMEMEAPEPPGRERKQRFPLLPLIAPLFIGVALYLATGKLLTLLFVALSPLMMVANVFESRIEGKRQRSSELAEFRGDLEALRADAVAARQREVEARLAENPALQECIGAVRGRSSLLWSRRPGQPGFLELRLGSGRLPSRNSIKVPSARSASRELLVHVQELAEEMAVVDGVPVAAGFADSGAIGVAGDRAMALPVARALLSQVACLHSPAEVVLAGFASPSSAADWEWLKWLPHTSSPHSPLRSQVFATSPTGSVALLTDLEGVIAERNEAKAHGALPRVVVLVEDDFVADRSRVVDIAVQGAAVGIHVLWLAAHVSALPAACGTFVDVHASGATASVGRVREQTNVPDVTVERADADEAMSIARIMSPLVDSGAAINDDSDLPRTVPWVALHGAELLSSAEAAVDRWSDSGSILTGPRARVEAGRGHASLRAIIGHTATDPHVLDLRVHGPHALVGGTTGAGKSELLQSWILSMAALHSPQRVNFLLVDYKGGSAFSECVHLPHTVGLVTDLSPHLVRRALTSLAAELHHRERLLGAKRAKDLMELEAKGDPEAPPSLVIVVDEFAALVAEVPEFVDGVVNVAQRGRSLGLHLVLATQRPAGVIKDNLRANTNLRVALRMADETDSMDVLGSPEAAGFDPGVPGRAVSKTGPGRLIPFQAAYVGGWTSDEPARPQIHLEELALGADLVWPEAESSSRGRRQTGPNDIRRVVGTLRAAHVAAQLPEPRRPWLPELAAAYELAKLPSPRRDDELVFGVVDDPARQGQPTVAFRPDRDGNLAVFGTGGSGKTGLLRTLAVAAGFTLRGGPCHVYGLDFGARGLQMLEELPHVGSVIPGHDHERLSRLIRQLRATIDERASRYAAVKAGSITEYRQLAGAPQEPRILLLLDGVAAFRQGYEVGEHSKLFDTFLSIAADGRQVGVHVIVSADRPGAVPTALASAIQRRVVLRLADDNDYGMLGLPSDVMGAGSPPGRGLLDDYEVQIAVLGGTPDVLAQAAAIAKLAKSMAKAGVVPAAPVGRLPDVIDLDELPSMPAGVAGLGISGTDLAATGFETRGSFLIVGPPGSGRTTALATSAVSAGRVRPHAAAYFFGSKRSPLLGLPSWAGTATTQQQATTLATEIAQLLAADDSREITVVIEGVADFSGTDADLAMQEMAKAVIATDNLLLCESEVSAMGASFGLTALAKTSRAGIALQPDQLEGNTVFRTPFPRINRADFPPGRALLVRRGQVDTVQVAIPPADPSVKGSAPHSPDATSLIPSQ